MNETTISSGTQEAVEEPKSVGFVTKFMHVLQGQTSQLVVLVFLFLSMSAFDLVGIGLIGPFIGAIIDPNIFNNNEFVLSIFTFLDLNSHSERLFLIGGVLVFVFVLKGVIAYRVQRRIYWFSFGFRAKLIKRLMHSYLSMPYQFYLDRNSASVIQSVIGHTKVMADDLLIPAMTFVSSMIVLFVLGVFLCWVSPVAMVVLTMLLGSAFFAYLYFVRSKVRDAGEEVAQTNERIIKGASQGLKGIKEIRSLQVERQFFDTVARDAEKLGMAQLKFYSLLALPRYLMEVVLVVFVIVFSLYALYLGEGSQYLLPVLAMFGAAGMRVLPAVTQASSAVTSINYSIYALDGLFDDLQFIEKNSGPHDFKGETRNNDIGVFKELSLENVCFIYPESSKAALSNISLTIKKGQSIGLVGQSGSGKTTLIDVLLGLHIASSGSISVNGASIDEFGWGDWLSQVAYIPQGVFLIDDSLARNVAFGIANDEIDLEKVKRCLEMSQLGDLFHKLPEGMETTLGEAGTRLSGGEKQRIALARAFYHDRNVFIFDEATSALDAETEKQVIKVIDSLHGEKTMIVIAHRLSTLRRCDLIVRLEAGTIVQAGSYNDVIGAE